MSGVKARICKDCLRENNGVLPTSPRPAPWPGPRCATHHRVETLRRKAHAHGRRIESDFDISSDDYEFLYACQKGFCYICMVSRGIVRKLAVDHDHKKCTTHPPEKGCRNCIRALLCKRCNQLVAWWGPEALRRAIEVLEDPPAQKWFAMQENTV